MKEPNSNTLTLLPIEKAALDMVRRTLTASTELQPFVLLSVHNRLSMIQLPPDSPLSPEDLRHDCLGLTWSFGADAVAFVAESWSAPANGFMSGIRASEHSERFESLTVESEILGNYGMRSYLLLRDAKRRFLGFGDYFGVVGLPGMGDVRVLGRPHTLLPGSHPTKCFRRAARKAMARWASQLAVLRPTSVL